MNASHLTRSIALAIAVALTTAQPALAGSPPFVPGQVIVGYQPPVASITADIRSSTHLDVGAAEGEPAPAAQLIELPRGESVSRAANAIRRVPGVAYAVPDYLAHTAAGPYIPNDIGRTHEAGGWQRLQWNFLAADGVDAPEAWANLIADHRAGARGITIAVIDTGVAFRNYKTFKRSPDFAGTRFVDPCDLISGKLRGGACTNRDPLDRDGHGTFVAGMIAEATNNHIGVTGLAYNASIMPIRVLNASGLGDADVIAQGIRYAVTHGAQVINLSLEFYLGITAGDIPTIVSAIDFAHAHNVVVVSAAGNDSKSQIAYPALLPNVISVGATTIDRCVAAYSNTGSGLDIVAPGGDDDTSNLPDDPDCHPNRNLPDLYQMTFNNPAYPDRFSLPNDWYGTSMSAAQVSAGAAMVIASGVIGAHPTPDQVLARLESTAEPLGPATPNPDYGYGLMNLSAATAPTPAVTTPPSSL